MSITSWLSISSRLQRLPTSLAKHTLSACQVLLAYLIISAVRMSVVTISPSTLEYNACVGSASEV